MPFRAFLPLILTVLALSVAAEPTRYGAGVDQPTATSIREILKDPAGWAGKTVKVEGKVSGVCAMEGCWMEIESPEGDRLRIKVDDGVIVFPSEAAGRHAVAQGTVEVHELTRERYVGWRRHLAEEKGTTFDEASVGEGPYRIVQIRGTGAEIAGE